MLLGAFCASNFSLAHSNKTEIDQIFLQDVIEAFSQLISAKMLTGNINSPKNGKLLIFLL